MANKMDQSTPRICQRPFITNHHWLVYEIPLSIMSVSVSYDSNHNNNIQEPPPPEDDYHLNFISFCLLGLAISVPYSSVMNATKTFESRLDTAFFSHFSAVYLTAKFLFLVFVMVSLDKSRLHGATGPALYSLCVISGLLMVISGVQALRGDLLTALMLGVSLVTSVVGAVAEAGAYSLAAQFPGGALIQALFIGGAIAGTQSSLTSFILSCIFVKNDPTGDVWFTWLNFGLGLMIVWTAALSWYFCQQTTYFKYHHNRPSKSSDTENEEEHKSRLIDVLLNIGDLCTFVFISGIASMIIWPFIPANTHSVAKDTIKEQWWQGHLFRPLAFLCSAVSSLIGRLLPSVPGMFHCNLPFVGFAFLKCFLIIVYMMGNVQLEKRQMIVSPLLANDILYFVLTAVTSIGSGYLTTVANMSAPDRVKPQDRVTVSNLMVFFTYYGDLVGTLFSTVVAVLMKTVLSVPLAD